MNILHYNTYDIGGAANACIRIHDGLLSNDINSNLIFLSNFHKLKSNNFLFFNNSYNNYFAKYLYKRYILFKSKIHYKIEEFLLSGRDIQYETITSPLTLIDLTKHPLYHKADIIHLHWVAQYLNYPLFFKHCNKPIVWTMHDMNPFTGGCHYSLDCKKFEINCNNCPQLQLAKYKNITKYLLHHKISSIKNTPNLNLVCVSNWLMQQSKSSRLFKDIETSVIGNGLDINIYKPANKYEFRKELNIDRNKKVILFLSQNLTKYSKGFHFFLESLNYIENKNNYIVLLVGWSPNEINIPEYKVIRKDFTNSINDIIKYYNIADITVVPSLYETFSQVTSESMACGTPVVAFDSSGPNDIISHNKSGYLSKSFNCKDFAYGIVSMTDNDDKWNVLSHNCRNTIVKNFDINVIVKKYIELYSRLLRNNKNE